MFERPPPSHVIGSRFWGASFSADEVAAIFNDTAMLQRWLLVEATLARTQGELGLIPTAAAERIVLCARLEELSSTAIRDDMARTGRSLLPLLWALGRHAGEPAAQYIHYGATTQDIQDTAQSLALQEAHRWIAGRVDALGAALCRLAEETKHLVMVGRTHSQPALPTTFGLVASWLDELVRGRQRLDEVARRVFVVQLFGGVGTMAGFGDGCTALVERFAGHLGLSVPALGWHNARDRIAELAHCHALLSGCLAWIANELILLERPEVGEVLMAPPGERLTGPDQAMCRSSRRRPPPRSRQRGRRRR